MRGPIQLRMIGRERIQNNNCRGIPHHLHFSTNLLFQLNKYDHPTDNATRLFLLQYHHITNICLVTLGLLLPYKFASIMKSFHPCYVVCGVPVHIIQYYSHYVEVIIHVFFNIVILHPDKTNK